MSNWAQPSYDFVASLNAALGAPPPPVAAQPPPMTPADALMKQIDQTIAGQPHQDFDTAAIAATPGFRVLGPAASDPHLPPPAAPPLPPPGPPPGPPMQEPPPQAVAAPAPAAAPSAPIAPDVQFRPVAGGGAVPAREVYMRGPQQNAHTLAQFEPPMEAAQRVDARNQEHVAREEAFYAQQADAAVHQQAVAAAVLAKRQAELQSLQQDYQDSVDGLGQMHLETNRGWANKSTPNKIGNFLLVMLGGLGAAAGGGENLAFKKVMSDINDDVESQKFDHQMGLEQLHGKQNAYAMMLQRYGSEDAAQAAVRAAGIDFAVAKANQLKAQYGGVESANRADDFIAQALAMREKTIADGFRFVPAAVSAPRYHVTIRGQTLPGTVSEKEAQNLGVEHGVKPAERVDEEMVKGGIAATNQAAKLAAERDAKGQEHAVVLPNGETVYPTSAPTADKIREAAVSMQKTQRLVKEAKAIREGTAFRAPLSSERARLGQIQAELLTDFGVQHKLGALSDKDYEIAQQGTASLFDVGAPVEARLNRLHDSANANLREIVKTVPGAKASAPESTGGGAWTSSWTKPGGKK